MSDTEWRLAKKMWEQLIGDAPWHVNISHLVQIAPYVMGLEREARVAGRREGYAECFVHLERFIAHHHRPPANEAEVTAWIRGLDTAGEV